MRKPAEFAEIRTLIHAMVRREDGETAPLCTWNQKEAKSLGTAMRSDPDVVRLSLGTAVRFCTERRKRMPESFLAQARAVGPLRTSATA